MNLGKLALSLPVPGDVAACLEWARRAEDLGYESIWIAETGGPDPFVLAGAVAQVTKRVRIGLGGVAGVHPHAGDHRRRGRHGRRSSRRGASSSGSARRAMPSSKTGTASPFERPLDAGARDGHRRARHAGRARRSRSRAERCARSGFRLMVPPAGPVPIYVGALRPAMLELAGEIGDGVAVNLFPVEALAPTARASRRRRAPRGQGSGALEIVCRQQVLVTDDKAARARSLPHRADRLLRHAGLQPVRRLVRLRRRGGDDRQGFQDRRPRADAQGHDRPSGRRRSRSSARSRNAASASPPTSPPASIPPRSACCRSIPRSSGRRSRGSHRPRSHRP